jgi:hypothetical protein
MHQQTRTRAFEWFPMFDAYVMISMHDNLIVLSVKCLDSWIHKWFVPKQCYTMFSFLILEGMSELVECLNTHTHTHTHTRTHAHINTHTHTHTHTLFSMNSLKTLNRFRRSIFSSKRAHVPRMQQATLAPSLWGVVNYYLINMLFILLHPYPARMRTKRRLMSVSHKTITSTLWEGKLNWSKQFTSKEVFSGAVTSFFGICFFASIKWRHNSTRPITGSKRDRLPPCLGTLAFWSEWVFCTCRLTFFWLKSSTRQVSHWKGFWRLANQLDASTLASSLPFGSLKIPEKV